MFLGVHINYSVTKRGLFMLKTTGKAGLSCITLNETFKEAWNF